jgi:hypothetical protein
MNDPEQPHEPAFPHERSGHCPGHGLAVVCSGLLRLVPQTGHSRSVFWITRRLDRVNADRAAGRRPNSQARTPALQLRNCTLSPPRPSPLQTVEREKQRPSQTFHVRQNQLRPGFRGSRRGLPSIAGGSPGRRCGSAPPRAQSEREDEGRAEPRAACGCANTVPISRAAIRGG